MRARREWPTKSVVIGMWLAALPLVLLAALWLPLLAGRQGPGASATPALTGIPPLPPSASPAPPVALSQPGGASGNEPARATAPASPVAVTAPLDRPSTSSPSRAAAGRASGLSPAAPPPAVPAVTTGQPPSSASAEALPLARCWEPSEFRPDPELEALIVSSLGPEVERYGVVVRNLTDGTEAAIQPEKVFYAASLYKLAVLYEVYRQERQGQLDFAQTLTVTEKYAEYDLGTLALLGWSTGSVITVAQAVEAMVTVSDNASAVLLADLVGWHTIDEGLRELGLRSMRVNDPELPVTASDLARLLDRIACGAAVDERASREMIALLARQRVRDRLPALLPEGVVVANKTGNWSTATHDAGIVYSPRATYVIVVLSETAGRSEPIARLSAAVYTYLNPPMSSREPGTAARLT